MSDLAQAAVGAILDADDPREVRAIRDVLRCGDLSPDEPDEDDAPPDKAAASRVQQWLRSRSIKRTTEACIPNKDGKGHHDDKTGFPCNPTGQQQAEPNQPPAREADKPQGRKFSVDPDLHPLARQALQTLAGSLKAATGLSVDQKHAYAETIQAVLKRMSPEALKRFNANIHEAPTFHASLEEVKAGLADWLDGKGYTKTGAKIRDTKGNIGGAYAYFTEGSERKGTLHLDGGKEGDKTGMMSQPGIYAHEFTHTIDGPNNEISNSPEWQEAWKAEINGGKVTLSAYGQTSASEGLAEFGRLLYMGGVKLDVVKARFPKCWAVFQQRKLIESVQLPAREVDVLLLEDEAQLLPELFAERIELDEAGHADALAEDVPEAIQPNRSGPGCHDTETGHPAPCPGQGGQEAPGEGHSEPDDVQSGDQARKDYLAKVYGKSQHIETRLPGEDHKQIDAIGKRILELAGDGDFGPVWRPVDKTLEIWRGTSGPVATIIQAKKGVEITATRNLSSSRKLITSEMQPDEVDYWVRRVTGAKVTPAEKEKYGKKKATTKESTAPNKSGPGCHDTETGHPAACPGQDQPDAKPAGGKGEAKAALAQAKQKAHEYVATGASTLQDELAAAYWTDPIIEKVDEALSQASTNTFETSMHIPVKWSKDWQKTHPKELTHRRDDLKRLDRVATKAIEAYKAASLSGDAEADRGKVLLVLRKAKLYAARGLQNLADLLTLRKSLRTQEATEDAELDSLEAIQPNKVGHGCHDTETGHPAPCPGNDEDAKPRSVDSQQVEAWVEEHYGEWIGSLRGSPEGKAQKLSAGSYCGNAYTTINGLLRDPNARMLQAQKPAAEKHTKNLDALFESVPGLPHAVTLARGVYGDFAKTVAALKPGDELHDKGFVSVTGETEHAKDFLKDEGYLLEIHIAKGTRVVPMTHFSSKQEGEILLPRGSRFRVMSNDGTRVHLELIGSGETTEGMLLIEADHESGDRFRWAAGDVTITQGSSESCVPNQKGKGYHDEHGHPCSPGGKDNEGGDYLSSPDFAAKQKRIKDYSPDTRGPKSKAVKAGRRYKDLARSRRVTHAVRNEGLLADAIGGFNLPDSEPADVIHVRDAAGKLINDREKIRAVLSRREMLVSELKRKGITEERKALVLQALESETVHFFEVKTLLTSPHGAVHMTKDARKRKERWERKYHAFFHVVAVDDRKGKKHSGHRVYVAPGELAGTFRIDKMQKASSLEEVLKLVGGEA